MPFDCYRCYLSLKNHFTKDSYDYHKYCGKSRATVQSFYKRKDRFWFEKISRQKTDQEVVDFFVSNFIACTDPGKLWIGEMMRDGDDRYTKWKKELNHFLMSSEKKPRSYLRIKKWMKSLIVLRGIHLYLKIT